MPMRTPDHDRRLRAVILSQRPCLTASLSSEVSPEAREFDRLSTTVANACIQPLMQGCHGQGQRQEVEITLSHRDLEPADPPTLFQTFGTAHARPFSRPVPGREIEELNGAVRVETVTPPAPTPTPRARRADRTGGRQFAVVLVHSGGTGTQAVSDRLSARTYPSGVFGSQDEITEAVAPVILWRRERRPDSGGGGTRRGGGWDSGSR